MSNLLVLIIITLYHRFVKFFVRLSQKLIVGIFILDILQVLLYNSRQILGHSTIKKSTDWEVFMIVKFKMTNFLSFLNPITLDMTANQYFKEMQDTLIIGSDNKKYLRSVGVYGANATGKSNLYFGLHFFRLIVINSMNKPNSTEKPILSRCYLPYAFSDKDDNIVFELTAQIKGNEYTYGFEYNDSEICREWLYSSSLTTKRKTSLINRDKVIRLGASVRQECDIFKTQIPSHGLALTFYSSLNLETTVFTDVFEAIDNMIFYDPDDNRDILESILPLVIDNEKERLLLFLSSIDSGIIDIEYEEYSNINKKEFITYHVGENNKKYGINLYNESLGTIKSIIVFIHIMHALHTNGLLVADEIDSELHPKLMEHFIKMFNNDKSTAQLLYTAHDPYMLNADRIRRDQALFISKDRFGHSSINPMRRDEKHSVRKDASYIDDYLQGKYSSIPTYTDHYTSAKNHESD